MIRRKRLNRWRRAGRFQFMRVSGRYFDGALDGREILYVRIKGLTCCYGSTPYPGSAGLSARVYYNDGTYFAADPVRAAHQFRAHMLRQLERTKQ